MHPDLNFQQAPPISVPFRFFLTAPLFGVAAGLLILSFGPAALTSRWAPATLALTHLLTLGFITLVMCGALMQMLPVLAGSVLPRPLAVSTATHTLLTAGTVALAAAFTWWWPGLLPVAGALLTTGFAVFIAAVSLALVRAGARGRTVVAMRSAVAALAVAVIAGVMLIAALAAASAPSDPVRLTNLHLAWGLLGWVGILVCGVAYNVVPMFQITARYPEWLTRFLVPVLVGALSAWSALQIFGAGLPDALAPLSMSLCAAGFTLFAAVTLRLQRGRKRRTEDVTRGFWYAGMASIFAATILWGLGGLGLPLIHDRLPFLLGAFVVVGFAISVIIAMLYKIVPFLVWFHLQRLPPSARAGGGGTVPNVRKVIPAARVKWHLRLHLFAIAVLILAAAWPKWLSHAAGLSLAASFALLWLNLLRAVLLYRRSIRPVH